MWKADSLFYQGALQLTLNVTIIIDSDMLMTYDTVVYMVQGQDKDKK